MKSILLHLLNRAFYEDIFPDILKIAIIIPVYKNVID